MSTHARSLRPLPYIVLCITVSFFGMPASTAQENQPSLLPHIVRVAHPTYGTYGNGYVYQHEVSENKRIAYAFFSYDCPNRSWQNNVECATLTDPKTTVTFLYEKKSYPGTIVGVYCHIVHAQTRMQSKCKNAHQHMRIGIVRFHVEASAHTLPPIIGHEAYDYRGRIPFCTQTKRFTPAKKIGALAIPFTQSETHVRVCATTQGWTLAAFDGTHIDAKNQEITQISKNIVGYPAYDPKKRMIVGMYLGKESTHVVSLRSTHRIIKGNPVFAHMVFYDFSCFINDHCDPEHRNPIAPKTLSFTMERAKTYSEIPDVQQLDPKLVHRLLQSIHNKCQKDKNYVRFKLIQTSSCAIDEQKKQIAALRNERTDDVLYARTILVFHRWINNRHSTRLTSS